MNQNSILRIWKKPFHKNKFLKEAVTEQVDLSSSGRLLQRLGAFTAKACSPSVTNLDFGTTSGVISEDLRLSLAQTGAGAQ